MSDPCTVDAFLGGRLRICQPRSGPRAGSDAVLLAAAVPASPGERVLELGSGSGAAALCLLRRVPGAAVVGLEIVPGIAELARRNARLNGLADSFAVVTGGVGEPGLALGEPFRHVMANPPFFPAEHTTASPDATRSLARSAAGDTLETWVRFAAGAAAAGGSLTMIHRSERLADLLAALGRRFGGAAVFPLWPGGDRPAKRVIVRAWKGSRGPLRLHPGLVLHDGSAGAAGQPYSAAAEAVLRHGGALPF